MVVAVVGGLKLARVVRGVPLALLLYEVVVCGGGGMMMSPEV